VRRYIDCGLHPHPARRAGQDGAPAQSSGGRNTACKAVLPNPRVGHPVPALGLRTERGLKPFDLAQGDACASPTRGAPAHVAGGRNTACKAVLPNPRVGHSKIETSAPTRRTTRGKTPTRKTDAWGTGHPHALETQTMARTPRAEETQPVRLCYQTAAWGTRTSEVLLHWGALCHPGGWANIF